MITPEVSVVVVTHGRPVLLRNTLHSIADQVIGPPWLAAEIVVVDDGDESGSVKTVCEEFTLVRRIYRQHRKPVLGWSNAAIPLNMGIKAAQGRIVVLHSGDVMYTKPTDLMKLLRPHEVFDYKAISLATCEKIGEHDGQHFTVHARGQRNLLFTFGCAFNREWAIKLGGIEESYEAWGHDEEDFARVLLKHGAQLIFMPPEEVLTHHQYHEWVPASRMNTPRDSGHFRKRCAEIEAGHLSNEGREWGIDR